MVICRERRAFLIGRGPRRQLDRAVPVRARARRRAGPTALSLTFQALFGALAHPCHARFGAATARERSTVAAPQRDENGGFSTEREMQGLVLVTSAAPVAPAGRDATLADMLSLSAPHYLLNSPVHASLLARISALKWALSLTGITLQGRIFTVRGVGSSWRLAKDLSSTSPPGPPCDFPCRADLQRAAKHGRSGQPHR